MILTFFPNTKEPPNNSDIIFQMNGFWAIGIYNDGIIKFQLYYPTPEKSFTLKQINAWAFHKKP